MNPFLEEDVPQTQELAAPVAQAADANPFLEGDSSPTPYVESTEVSLADKLAFASQLGFSDTYRGVKQIFGVDEEEMSEEQARLNSYLQDEEDGGSVLAAYTAGLFGDPVGWVIPGMKAKNAYSAMKAGVVAGGIVGATGYNDEATGLNRAEQTLLGVAGGGVLSPALFKLQHTLWPTIKASYATGLDKAANTNLNKKVKGYVEANKGKVLPSKLGGWFIDNYGLPESYVKAKKNQRIDHEKYAAKFINILEKQSKLKPEEDALLYRILTGEESKVPANLELLTKESRKVVDDMGQELVDLGMLDAKIYNANKGKYLYRSYEKTSQPQVKRLIRDSKKIKIFGAELMRRGKTEKISIDDLDTYTQAGFKQVSSPNRKGQVVVNRDWTKKERTDMGEVISAQYGMAKTGKLMTNDISTFKFYDTISKDKNLVWSPKTKEERLLGAPEGYKQIPSTKKDTINQYGNLAGKWVPQNAYNDITFANQFKVWKGSGLGKLQHNMQTWWKRTKTSLNPVVHMNNVMSNVVLYDFVDAGFKHLGPAARELMSRSGDFTKANSLGVFQADLMKQELTKMEKDIFKTYMSSPTTGGATTVLNEAWNKTKSLGQYMKHTHLDALYGTEDNIFRLGLFKDRLAKGDTDNEAAAFARKYMLDYELHAPGIKLMRETGWPFISYIYRAAPIVAETAVKRPWKVAKWGLVLEGANQLGADVAEGDIEKERKLQKELNQGTEVIPGLSGTNTMIKVPRTDKSQYLDVSRWVPAGDVLDTSSQGFGIPFVPAPLQPSGGALGGLAKTILGFDTYTQKKVPGVGSGVVKDELAGRGGLFIKEFFPMTHNYDKLDAAFSNTDGRRHPSKDDYTKGEALLGAIGIKLKEFDLPKMASRVSYKYKNRMQSLIAVARKNTANYQGGRIEKEDYLKEIKRIERELNTISKEANEALN